jgi:class 3 adenylate cyclase
VRVLAVVEISPKKDVRFISRIEDHQTERVDMSKSIHEKDYLNFTITNSLQRGRQDAAFGILVYNAFLLWDWSVAPEQFATLLSIRLSVTSIWLVVAYLHNHPIIQSNLRLVYLGLLHISLNSLSLIGFVAFDQLKPLDYLVVFLALTYAMSAFHIMVKDAAILGLGFIASFTTMLLFRSSSQEFISSNISSVLIAFVLGLAGAIVSERYTRRAFENEKLLQAETNRADNLLVKTFPFEVAKELKFAHTSQARRFEEVSVMFCDIVNFSEASAKMTPEELVHFLNDTFSIFDRLTGEHGCEKIKTIGDSYMAVCGAPSPDQAHAERIVRLAFALQNATSSIELAGRPLAIRIGIDSGPVVAGVIGETRFAYDLWGDTVNTASRMESMAMPGSIRITESTKLRIEGTFVLQALPEANVKGKGIMKSWIVIGLKNPYIKESPDSTHVAA